MIMKKYYNSNEIYNEFDKLSKDKKIVILYEAIDYMQQYNGRSRFQCISLAMGYENDKGDKDSYYKRNTYNQ